MSKITLDSVTRVDDVSLINTNFQKLQTELQDKVLYRDNPDGEPNTLETNIDANGHSIYNATEVRVTDDVYVNGESLLSIARGGVPMDTLMAAVESAQESMEASAASATESANSAALVDASNIVHKTLDETIDGIKTFNSSPIVPTLAYDDNSQSAANSAYVRQAIKKLGGSVTVSDVAPTDPENGTKWINTNDGIEYTYVVDGDSNQWVNFGGGVDFSNIVHRTGDEAIEGIKTYSISPIVPEPVVSDDSLKASSTSWTRKFFTSTSLGWGQTWQSVTASRVAGTNYTNTTGRPMQVNVVVTASSSGTSLSGYAVVSGVTVCNVATPPVAGFTPTSFFSFIVPNGATYSVTVSFGGIAAWSELK